MGQDKREIPRQGNSLNSIMQTPEKYTYGQQEGDVFANQNSGPSPTAEKLS